MFVSIAAFKKASWLPDWPVASPHFYTEDLSSLQMTFFFSIESKVWARFVKES